MERIQSEIAIVLLLTDLAFKHQKFKETLFTFASFTKSVFRFEKLVSLNLVL